MNSLPTQPQHFSDFDIERIDHRIRTGRPVDAATLAAASEHVICRGLQRADGLQEEIAELESQVEDLESKSSSAEDNVAELESKVERLEGEKKNALAALGVAA
jgi:peptidoglycan hydrolase CwlO-like protein